MNVSKKNENSLIIFLRYPEPGRVKTRLARDIGNERAARVYKKMAEMVVENTAPRGVSYSTIVFYSPKESAPGVREWLRGSERGSVTRFLPQEGRTLGERIDSAFKTVFALGSRKAVIIGTDCPAVTNATIDTAFEALYDHDLVIGPAEDGGYYLLGLKAPRPALFSRIEWGGERVLEETLDRAVRDGLLTAQLETLPDIDTYDDLLKHGTELLGDI